MAEQHEQLPGMADLERMTITITMEEREMLRQLMERRYPGRRGMTGVLIGEAIRRLYEAEVSKR